MPLNNSTGGGISEVTSANSDIAVATGTTTPQLTLNSGSTANKIVKLDGDGKLPALDGSQLTNIASSSDVAYLNEQQLIQNIDILRALANGSLAISDYTTMFCDIFSDNNGYSNTIDTGNTTGAYNGTSKKYNNGTGSVTTDQAHNAAFNESGGRGGAKCGAKITMGTVGGTLNSITKSGSSGVTKGYLLDSSKSVIATADFSGNTATFGSPPTLSANTTYYFASDNNGSGFTGHWRSNGTNMYPITSTYLSWVAGLYDGDDSSVYLFEILSANITVSDTPSNRIVQSNTITLSGNSIAYQLYTKKTLAGSGAVQFKVSFDNGSNWSSAKELNTKYTNATTGTSMKIQILLNGSGSGNTSEIENYSLMVWY